MEVNLPLVLVAIVFCLVVVAFAATWFFATNRFNDLVSRLLPFKESSSVLSIYVDQYQGEGKPTLVRLISGQRSLDTRMWQSSVTMKIGDLLTVELFEDSTFGTFGPRFMGRATLRRKELEALRGALKNTKWLKIEKNGQAIGSLKLELQIVKERTTSISNDEKDALVKPDVERPEDMLNNESKSQSSSHSDQKSVGMEPPDAEELWQTVDQHVSQNDLDTREYESLGGFEPGCEPPGYEYQEYEPHEPPGYEYQEYEPPDPPGYEYQEFEPQYDERILSDEDWGSQDGDPPGFSSEPPWDEERVSRPQESLDILAAPLEGPLLKTNTVNSASRFVTNSRWKQRYFKVYKDVDDWMLGYWKSEEEMLSGDVDAKIIAMHHINEVIITRSHHRDQFVVHYRMEDGVAKQLHLRVVDRPREDWVESLEMFLQEWRAETSNEEHL